MARDYAEERTTKKLYPIDDNWNDIQVEKTAT